ncbi:FAD-dependent monooxygenase [Parvularcula bermudensis]|nr:FAD-dependent monooxygenase [Parvularcula bermudensis]
MSMPLYDVAIAGAGLTGRLAALALAHHGLSVALIDPVALETPKPDSRTTAIAYANARILKRLGLWPGLSAKAGAITDILVTNGRPASRFRRGGAEGSALHFPAPLLPGDRLDPTAPALGYILTNTDLLAVFGAALQATAGVTFFKGAIEDVTEGPARVHVAVSGGEAVEAAMLLVCDGKRSTLRAKLGFRTLSHAYDQEALTFCLSHSTPHQGVAHEMFYPDGPFAILPMAGDEVSIVWTEKGSRARAYHALDEAAFLRAVTDRIGPLLGDIAISRPAVRFPLSFSYADQPVKGRVVLMGDAYRGVHPIAGQGFNLAMKDIAVLADVLRDAEQVGLDPGSPQSLDAYARWRRFDSAALAFGTDALTRLFSNDIAPIRWARSFGLGRVAQMDGLRLFFMREAGADSGELPSLMAA